MGRKKHRYNRRCATVGLNLKGDGKEEGMLPALVQRRLQAEPQSRSSSSEGSSWRPNASLLSFFLRLRCSGKETYFRPNLTRRDVYPSINGE